jgi:hypothetical protein
MLVHFAPIEPLIALGVVVATAGTDAVYVLFSAAVAGRRRVSAATWSSAWYLLSSFAVISYTSNWEYVCFAAAGSWIGAYASMSWLQKSHVQPKSPLAAPPVNGHDDE